MPVCLPPGASVMYPALHPEQKQEKAFLLPNNYSVYWERWGQLMERYQMSDREDAAVVRAIRAKKRRD